MTENVGRGKAQSSTILQRTKEEAPALSPHLDKDLSHA